jgi:HSP20 family protein
MTFSIRPYYRPYRLTELMDRLFDETFVRNGLGSFQGEAFSIPMDVQAKGDEYLITAVVPGLKPDDLHVEILNNTVTLSGEVFAPAPDEKANWLLQERVYGKFSRSITLPVELDGGKADAHLEHGILTLRLPKAETAKPKAIAVKTK